MASKAEFIENAPFLVWTGENGDEESVIYCHFYLALSGVLVRKIGENASKSACFRMKMHSCGQVNTKLTR